MNDPGQISIFDDFFQEEVDVTKEVCLLFWFFYNISGLKILHKVVDELPRVPC